MLSTVTMNKPSCKVLTSQLRMADYCLNRVMINWYLIWPSDCYLWGSCWFIFWRVISEQMKHILHSCRTLFICLIGGAKMKNMSNCLINDNQLNTKYNRWWKTHGTYKAKQVIKTWQYSAASLCLPLLCIKLGDMQYQLAHQSVLLNLREALQS